ncbi:MAG: hypothetical protein IH968_17085 [Gemmatimonadetes bacterium]|nr:hypothetical protein [Gemmatimonadota bacterium]
MSRLNNKTPLFFILLASAGMTVGTTGCPPVDAPTGPEQTACEANNSAQISFRNNSNTNRTYNVIWDGSNLVTITPGSTSRQFTVAAGVQHTLVFRFTNTNTNACNPSTPTLSQCSTGTISCTG